MWQSFLKIKLRKMGTLYEERPLLQDFKVIIHQSSLVTPSQKSDRNSIFFLSNIDQVLNFDVQTVHFFPAHKDFPPQTVAEKLRETLGEMLVNPYNFLAGRLKLNAKTGRLEIDCNDSGVGFVVASSEFTLDEIGDLVYPNPGFAQLVTITLDTLKPEEQPLGIFQVTSFKCGGFAIGISTNHATFDGLSFKLFLQNLAAALVSSNNKSNSILSLTSTPCNDRQLLAARSPPRVTFPHPELLKLTTKTNIPQDSSSNSSSSSSGVFEATQEDLHIKLFRLNSATISHLKDKAKPQPAGNNNDAVVEAKRIITSFNVVTALVWQCKALSSTAENNADRESTILYAVDIRPRLNPPLPASYSGNAVLSAYARATCRELEEGPFSRTVEMVWEGARRMTDEYARSVIDWGELYKGFPHGEVMVSSWWKLGFEKVEYPWGKPRYSCPVVYHRKDIILLLPDIDEDGGVVNVLVALPPKEMEKFQTIFHNLLA